MISGQRFKFFLLLCGSILAALPASAQQIDYERILLPVYVRARSMGAFGTIWSTPFWAYNDSDNAVAFVPNVFCDAPPPLTSALPPHQAVSPNLYGTPFYSANEFDAPVPWLVFLDRLHSEDVTLALQLVGSGGATQIPVIRERDFRTGRVQLLNVPPLQGRRLTVRTYDPDVVANASVAIRITTRRGTELFSAQRALQGGGGRGCFSDLPQHPNFDVLTLSEDSMAPNPAGESLRIEITPLGGTRRLTAMATTTDDATAAVTVTTPF